MKLSSTENTIINAMARAFYVSAYADLQDRHREAGKGYKHPGAGGDWYDIAPKTPRYAREFALVFTGQLGRSLLVLLNEAAWADIVERNGNPEVKYRFEHPELQKQVDYLTNQDSYLEEFGRDLAMQGMGHGVSWFDDHAKFEIDIPLVEACL